jgi:hypothetical protein
VTVYSARRLSIDDSGDSGSGYGVHEDSLPESDGAYRYRYQGLRDSDTIRVEIRRGTQR